MTTWNTVTSFLRNRRVAGKNLEEPRINFRQGCVEGRQEKEKMFVNGVGRLS